MPIPGPSRHLKRSLLELLRTGSAGGRAEWFLVWAKLIDDRFYLRRLRRTVEAIVRDRAAPREATQFLREEIMLRWARRLAHPLARAPTAELVESDCGTWLATLIIEDAQHALRQSFVFTETHVMSQPEIKIPAAAPLFDASGKLTDENTRQHVKKFLEAFAVWIGRFKD